MDLARSSPSVSSLLPSISRVSFPYSQFPPFFEHFGIDFFVYGVVGVDLINCCVENESELGCFVV